MHPLDNDPVLFVLYDTLPRERSRSFHGVSYCCAGIDVIHDNLIDHRRSPANLIAHSRVFLFIRVSCPEILSRRRDAVVIQSLGNNRGIVAIQCLVKHSPDDCGGFRVQFELVPDLRVKDISVGSIAAHILALLHHLDFRRCCLYREVLTVCGIYDVAHYDFQTARCPFVIVAVVAVVDRYEADAEEREDTFEVVAGFDVVSRKAGKILDTDQVYFPGAYLFHHLRELRTPEVGAGITVVCKLDTTAT